MRLTKRNIDAAEYRGGTDYHWDESLPNFGLRIYPSGRKSFVSAYRLRGRKRIMVLGSYGVLTPTEARKRAQRVLADASEGKDPSQARQDSIKAPTVALLASRYLDEYAATRKKAKSIEEDQRMWKRHILPVLGQIKVADVAREDIADLHHRLRKTPYAANRVLALLSKAFNLAEMWGLRSDHSNPCRHVERYKESKRERFLGTEELQRLGAALNEAERTQSEHPSAILAVRLLLLTGARKQEILKLRWTEVDWKHSCLRLADSKTGQKVISLGPPALELLRQAQQKDGNLFVCYGYRGAGNFVGLQRPWARITEAAGLDGVRIHDLRHTHASVGVAAGLSLPIIGKLLGHTQPQTTARYAHLADDPQQQAAARIAGEIAERLGYSQA